MGFKTTSWTPPALLDDAFGPRPVLMVTTSYPTPKNPVAGVFVETLARVLRQRGHHVEVLTPSPRGPQSTAEHVTWRDFPGRRFSPFHSVGLPELIETGDPRLFAVPPALCALAMALPTRLSRMGGRTVLLAHWAVPGLGFAALAAALGYDAVVVAHSGGARLMERLLPTRLDGALGPLMRRVGWMTSCNEITHVLQRWGIKPLTEHLPVRVPTRVAQPPSGQIRIGFMGRLEPVKGLMEALPHLAGRGVEVHLAGEGTLRKPLQARAQELGVQLHCHGLVLGQEKERLLSTWHGVLYPSIVLGNGRTEGLPTFVVEAVEMGIPVLASTAGGLATFSHPLYWAEEHWPGRFGDWLTYLEDYWRKDEG